MSNIVYLLGAGSSRGRRAENDLSFPTEQYINGTRHLGNSKCANIISGLPIVSEISGRLELFIQKLWDVYNKESKQNNNSSVKTLIDDMQWLKDSSANHSTIDTFAKKLFLTYKQPDYQRLKNCLLVFLLYEQLIKKPDQRYDTFLASILHNNVTDFPNNISIISWNYDYQLELAYQEYLPHESLETISNHYLHSFDKNTDGKYEEPYHKRNRFQVLKLNGSSFVSDVLLTSVKKGQEVLFLIELYPKLTPKNNLISFAWERMMPTFEKRLSDSFLDTDILVVIGYSFPFFNREIDRKIFSGMPKLKKIYIQDPYADNVRTGIIATISDEQRFANKIEDHIVPIRVDSNQFFLPPEL